MDAFASSMQPLAGGFSGETFLSVVAGEESVVRVYAGRSAQRGSLAPEIDAAVLELVRGLLPVPAVLDVRRGNPDADLPGLLVTSRLPGERLDLLLPVLDDDQRVAVGTQLGTIVGRLGHMVQPRAGLFTDRSLAPQELPEHRCDLPAWVRWHEDRLDPAILERVHSIAEDAQDLLDEDRRVCLVHGDLDAANLLVDPDTLEVTGVLDWELARAGSAYADLGSVLRLEDHPGNDAGAEPVLAEAVVAAYGAFMPWTPADLEARARAADLFALIDLAARPGEGAAEGAARAHLARIVG